MRAEHRPHHRTSRGIAAAVGLVLIAATLPLLTPAESRATEATTCPAGRVPAGAFADVSSGSVHAGAIDCAAWWGITSGLSDGTYGGDATVTRGQLATFLGRSTALASRLPTGAPNAFNDDDRTAHESALNALAVVGIIRGDNAGRSGHGSPVTRSQAASMVARTLAWLDGEPLPAGPDAFADDAGSPHEAAANSLASLGVMQGTDARTLSPDRSLGRAQMASILVRSLDRLVGQGLVTVPGSAAPVLPEPGDPGTPGTTDPTPGSLEPIEPAPADPAPVPTEAAAKKPGPTTTTTAPPTTTTTVPGRSDAIAPARAAEVTSAQATALDRAVQVSWNAAGVDPHNWKVLAFSDGRYVGQRTFPPAATSGRIGQLPPGTSITTWVVPMLATGWWNPWVVTAPVQLPRDPGCPATDGACVHVNAATPGSPANGAGLGFSHGVTAGTDPDRVADLGARHWRVSTFAPASFALAREAGAHVTAILSDAWKAYTATGDGRMLSPWADWPAYEAYVDAAARWHKSVGLLPDAWEIQNEPGEEVFAFGATATVDLLVEQHLRAAAIIRSIIPGAKIVGPSQSPPLFGHGGVRDLAGFVERAKARGLALDGLTWHENQEGCWSCDGGGRAARQHIDDVRALLDANGLAGMPLDVTEFAGPYEQRQPGALVGYLAAFADGGVRFAGTACWHRPVPDGDPASSCNDDPGTVGGLLLHDGTTPTDAWWTLRSYAQLAQAGARLVGATVDDPHLSAVASTTDAAGVATVQALIGHHHGCTAADTDAANACPADAPSGPPKPVTVNLTLPSSGAWTVVVTHIVSNAGGAGPPVELQRSTVQAPAEGPLSVGTFTLADGDVLRVEATPA